MRAPQGWFRRLQRWRYPASAIFDALIWFPALWIAVLARQDFDLDAMNTTGLVVIATVAASTQLITGVMSGLYRGRRPIASYEEVRLVALSTVIAALAALALVVATGPPNLVPISTVFAGAAYQLILALGARYIARIPIDATRRSFHFREHRALIFGSGDAGRSAARAVLHDRHTSIHPVGFIDDDPTRRRMRSDGLSVVGTSADLESTAELLDVDTLLVAVEEDANGQAEHVAQLGRDAGLDVKILLPPTTMAQESSLSICHVFPIDTTAVRLLLPLMRYQRDLGFDVAVVTGSGRDTGTAARDAAALANEGFKTFDIPVKRRFFSAEHFRTLSAYYRLFRREQFDIVNAHTPVASVLARLAAATARCPNIVYTAHGFYFHENMRRTRRWAAIGAEWLAGRFTHLLLSQSEEDGTFAARMKLTNGPIVVIGNGVDPDRFKPDPAVRRAVRQQRGASDDDVVVLIVARLVAEKGYEELLDAVRDLDVDLWIIGTAFDNRSGEDIRHRLAAAIADNDATVRIQFLGRQTEVERYMQAADIYVLPSHREGMPRTIIEAMMSRLPVVATDIRGSREEVVNGETGILVPVRHASQLRVAINELAHDKQLRETLGRAGRKRALEMYVEADALMRQTEAIGRNLLDEGQYANGQPTRPDTNGDSKDPSITGSPVGAGRHRQTRSMSES